MILKTSETTITIQFKTVSRARDVLHPFLVLNPRFLVLQPCCTDESELLHRRDALPTAS